MKKLMITLFALLSVTVYGQEPVLTYKGDLYFIPGSMTKAGEAFMMSANYNENSVRTYTIYDGDFKVVKSFTDPTIGIPYQQREVRMSCIYELESEQGGTTRGVVTDWTVDEDQILDLVTDTKIQRLELYDDNNNYHSRSLYISQTFFNTDDDFEYVRARYDIIPITTTYEEYAKEHPRGDNSIDIGMSWGDAKIDSIMKATGADSYDFYYDEARGKNVLKLHKTITYGGLYYTGLEIVSLDGTVKAFLPGITSVSSAYKFRGKCYVRGYGKDNTNVLYLLGENTTNVREISRQKAVLSIERVGNNLIVNNTQNTDQTVVVSNMAGQIFRQAKAVQGKTIISVNGLQGGVYNVTLFEHSTPVESAKIILK